MKVELLAPAGSFEAFEAALSAGADAVYVGGSRFGARAYAENLDQEQLCRAIDRVHLLGKKLYMTVNTLLKDRELEELYEYMLPFTGKAWTALLSRISEFWLSCGSSFRSFPSTPALR